MFNQTFKVLVRKNNLFHRGDSQDGMEPPHYELFTLRDKVSLITLLHYYLFVVNLSQFNNISFRGCLGTSGSYRRSCRTCRLSGDPHQAHAAFTNTTAALRPPSTRSKQVRLRKDWARDPSSCSPSEGTSRAPYLPSGI